MKRSSLLVVSLLANMALAAWIGWMVWPSSPTLVAHPVIPSAPAPAPVVQPEPEPPALPPKPAFNWSQVESTDFAKYAGNLREIGCPEAVIRRIITAELDDLYTQRRQQLLAPWQDKVWPEAASAIGSPLKWMEKMRPVEQELRASTDKLLKEKQEVLKTLLGDPPKPNPEVTERYTPEFLADLPAEKQKQMLDLEDKYGKLNRELRQKLRGKPETEVREQMEELKRQKQQEAQTLLTTEEYAEYRLRSSNAASLRYQVVGFDASPEEWRSLVQVKMNFDEAHPNPNLSVRSETSKARQAEMQKARQSLDDQYQSILGADRYKTFKLSQEEDYKSLYQVVERCELPPATAAQAYDIKRSAENSARQLRDNSTLTPEQRLSALSAIQQETRKALSQTLGDRAFQTYTRNGGDWLNKFGKP